MLRSREAWTFASSHSFSTPPSKADIMGWRPEEADDGAALTTA
ncbi:hypothetical protein ACFWMU_27920 [Streptomyces sp. NPDC058357]